MTELEQVIQSIDDKFGMVADRLNVLTNEVVSARREVIEIKGDISAVKEDIRVLKDEEIEIVNGNNIPIQVKRDDVIAMSYQFLKPGGSIDKKLDEINVTWTENHVKCQKQTVENLKFCQEAHSPSNIVGRWGEKAAKWQKAGQVIVWFILLVMIFGSYFLNHEDRTKQSDELKTTIKTELKQEREKLK